MLLSSEEGLSRTMRIVVFLSSLLLTLVVGNTYSITTATTKDQNDVSLDYYDHPQPLSASDGGGSNMNPYDVLGIEVGSSERKIKQTFRKLVDEKCGAFKDPNNNNNNLCANNKQYLDRIIQSYEALIDVDTRKENWKNCNNWYCFDADEYNQQEEEQQQQEVEVLEQKIHLYYVRNSLWFLLMVVIIGFVLNRYYRHYCDFGEEEKCSNNKFDFGSMLLSCSSCCSFFFRNKEKSTSVNSEDHVVMKTTKSSEEDHEVEEFVVEDEESTNNNDDCDDWEIVN